MHAERASIDWFMQRDSNPIASLGAPKIMSRSKYCGHHCSQGGSFDGVQLENRLRLSHKDALNQGTALVGRHGRRSAFNR
jgi:hypothetical protein